MSGGSYNYLCYKTADQLLGAYSQDLIDMRNRLDLLCPEAAEETAKIIEMIREAQTALQTKIDSLSDLWHAVEWHDSCDIGEKDLQEAITKWRGKR